MSDNLDERGKNAGKVRNVQVDGLESRIYVTFERREESLPLLPRVSPFIS